VTVSARADGGATAEVPLVYGFNDVKVTSTSTNGWVSPPAEINYYADNSPTVSSPDYPENGDCGGPAGQPGTFTLSSNLAGSTRFAYSFDGLTWETVPVGPDGTATITWTPTSPGFQNLYAYSETADGIQSDWYLYGFAVS
jgi:hypothetical protein